MSFKFLLAGIFLVFQITAALAQERVFSPGSNSRQNMLACPQGALMTGVDPTTSRILCRGGFDDIAATERVDGPNFGGASQWPPGDAMGVGNIQTLRSRHDYRGPDLHWCGPDRVMTGVHIARNEFLCAELRFSGSDYGALRRYDIGTRSRRQGIPACPQGMVLVGLHAGQQILLCAEMGQCASNDHCSRGMGCVSDPAFADRRDSEKVRTCRIPTSAQLFKRNGCHGDLVTTLSASSGFDYDLGDDGDEARSLRLRSRPLGVFLSAFDRDDASVQDDATFVGYHGRSATPCLSTFELPDFRLTSGDWQGRYTGGDNLDGKVSRIRFASLILSPRGFCLDPVASEFPGPTLVTLKECTDAFAGWFRGDDGSIRTSFSSTRELCLHSGDARGSAPFVTTCNGDAAEKWTFTPSGNLKTFSNRCLTVPTGTESDGTAPVMQTCSTAAASRQRWGGNF